MKTIALRFAENFAPPEGTIAAHQQIIEEHGYVWYGKLGSPVSESISAEILKEPTPRILLIHSGGQQRYWAYVSAIQREMPSLCCVPQYYRHMAEDIGCWFKVSSFERAEDSVMSHCFVISSGKRLTEASRHSMSPYFIIRYEEETAS